MNYNKWLKLNARSLENKNVFFVGATGSIGFESLLVIASLKANITIGARNVNKANCLINKVKEKYPDVNINVLELDVSSLESINNLVYNLEKENIKFDYFINNAGVYHLPFSLSKDNVEITFATNALGCIYLVKNIIPFMKENGVINVTSSISYRFYNLDYNDIGSFKINNKFKKYSLSKRAMLEAFIYIKKTTDRKDLTFNLSHPGICATELFQKSHSKAFMTLIFPLMKLIFHSPKIASTSLIYALFNKTDLNQWIGPKGLFNGWGFPKISKLKKKALINNKRVYDYFATYYEK